MEQHNKSTFGKSNLSKICIFCDLSYIAQVQDINSIPCNVRFAQTRTEVAILYLAKLCSILEGTCYLFYNFKGAKKYFKAKTMTSNME